MNDFENMVLQAKEALKKLPRNERRSKERQLDKISKGIKALTPAQIQLIDAISSEKTIQEMDKFNYVIDSCISAYLILSNPDKTLKEIELMEDELAELIEDHLKKVKNQEKMGEKKMKKNENEVREKCEELIKKGITAQNEAVKILQDTFPMLSKTQLANAFKKTKAALKEEMDQQEEINKIEDKETRDAVAYVLNDDKAEKVTPKAKITPQNNGKSDTDKPKEEKRVITPVKEKESQNRFELNSMKVTGEFGQYEKTSYGVCYMGMLYSTREDIEEAHKSNAKNMDMEIAKLEERLKEFKDTRLRLDGASKELIKLLEMKVSL